MLEMTDVIDVLLSSHPSSCLVCWALAWPCTRSRLSHETVYARQIDKLHDLVKTFA
jgi:hypothetical protein